ncbi:MAG TPA: 16S rRNA (adenine(1518)-N(6)/adenine(1519)-N(6))-dimethyltransferase RsmA [Bryobacteraceae bacterium]|nr:16S rRNA (adenine(1518)-N(6)/adenine(1519)-N(6))-dimethyltransferase RsmA [Bryobacteraceae bacterium]
MPRKLGQHFLTARSFLERIAAAACPSRVPLLVEVGPGRGALTEHLIPRCDRLVAIEIDPLLAAGLRERFPSVEVVEADVLETDLSSWGDATVAGNLPYYITSPIVERVLAMGPLLQRAVFLVQREVAERLAASPGSRDYGYLTVHTQLFAEARYLFRVPPGAFSPPPKVDSAVVLLTPRTLPVADIHGFLEFASRAFRQKRKTLRNNLAPHYGDQVARWPEAGMRAEQLSVEKLIALYQRIGSAD